MVWLTVVWCAKTQPPLLLAAAKEDDDAQTQQESVEIAKHVFGLRPNFEAKVDLRACHATESVTVLAEKVKQNPRKTVGLIS